MKSCDTFTIPRRAQAAGRIHLAKRWSSEGSLSISRGVTAGHCRCPEGVRLGHSAMWAEGPVCPKADTAGRFMSARPWRENGWTRRVKPAGDTLAAECG